MCSSDWFEVGGSLEKHDVTLDQSKVYGWKPLSIKCDQITPRQSLWSAPVITEYCRHFMWKPDFSVWNVSATQCPQEIPQWNEEAVSNKRALLLASNPTMKCVSVCGWKKNERRLKMMIRGRLGIFEGRRQEKRVRPAVCGGAPACRKLWVRQLWRMLPLKYR